MPGSTQRLSGTLPLASVATELSGAFPLPVPMPGTLGDFDLEGDGLSDVVLADSSGRGYLFYGAPGLFHDGVDLTAADALLGNTFNFISSVGDLDGDGDTELLGSPNPQRLRACIHVSEWTAPAPQW
ncbi:MAG TPA: VCBS repeat-containing protein [Polyangiaceae bacterium]|nr:VCBS repeat-containing protein [Polyangiaceae bacterium]